MLATVSHNHALLAFLAIAEIETQARRPFVETPAFSALLTLMIGIQPDVARLSETVAAGAMIASALAAGKPNVDGRSLARLFPREAPKLVLAAQRLRSSYAEHPVTQAVLAFNEALADTKHVTLDHIMTGFSAPPGPLAAVWRSAADSAAKLLRAIDAAFGERKLGAVDEGPLLAFVDEAAAGGYSAVASDGSLVMPRVHEGREHKRVPVFCPATVIYDDMPREAVLRDLSVGGLGLEALEGVPKGAEIKVVVGTMTLTGRVEWLKDDRAGVRLDVPLEADDPRLRFLER